MSDKMKKTCSVSRLPITAKPKLNYKDSDENFSTKLSLIGDNILLKDYFKHHKLFYALFDITDVQSAMLESLIYFADWTLKLADRIPCSVFFGLTKIMRAVVRTDKAPSSKFSNVIIADEYHH